MDFSKFDNMINKEELAKQIKEAKENQQNYKEVPADIYICSVDKLEIRATKDGRPMLSCQMRILDGDWKKHCIFMNRVLYGTKNDGNMINSAIGWLEALAPEDIVVYFDSYSQFSDLVLDIFESLDGCRVDVTYDPDAFNSITIEAVEG